MSSNREIKLRRIGQAHLTIGLARWQAIINRHHIGKSWELTSNRTINAIYQENGPTRHCRAGAGARAR